MAVAGSALGGDMADRLQQPPVVCVSLLSAAPCQDVAGGWAAIPRCRQKHRLARTEATRAMPWRDMVNDGNGRGIMSVG